MATIPNKVVEYPIFYLEKEITSSAITTSAATIFSTIGDAVMLEAVTLATDSTGLAGGTNFVLSTDSAYGNAAALFTETVANLGANKTINTGSVASNVPAYLPAGTNIKVNNTVGAGTGAGVIKVILRLRKLNGNSAGQVV